MSSNTMSVDSIVYVQVQISLGFHCICVIGRYLQLPVVLYNAITYTYSFIPGFAYPCTGWGIRRDTPLQHPLCLPVSPSSYWSSGELQITICRLYLHDCWGSHELHYQLFPSQTLAWILPQLRRGQGKMLCIKHWYLRLMGSICIPGNAG